MVVTNKMYSQFPYWTLRDLLGGDINSVTIKVMLCTSSYTPNQDDHAAKNQITNEISGTGYSAGGKTIGGHGMTVSGRVSKFDASGDVTWASSTLTARYAILYDDTPAADSDKILILYVDFGETKSSSSGDFEIQWNASGIFTITVAA